MTGRLAGRVVVVTGAARGQGRSHAERFAEEGADLVLLDHCAQVDSVPYPLATPADLAETAALAGKHGHGVLAVEADVRDLAALESVRDTALERFGRIDVVLANAGVGSFGPALELTEQQWDDVVDIDLTGVWKTVRAFVPPMVTRGDGGSVVLTSSVAGLVAFLNLAHYTAAKHGVTGLMKALAVELAPHRIRVNSLHPTTVDTPMIDNTDARKLFLPGVPDPDRDTAAELMKSLNALPVPWVESIDVSNAALWLASDEARYITGIALPIDAGATAPYKIPH
ncbi:MULTISPECIES: mycofactocin-coupled SDR family oxidoreductase [Pseudonocardia]|uniref:Oxidoreductase n=2 Tax=Pseudonocardia TaxID=1847 RepID=A0ABQ0RW74_9PSEU|nr:MULTISPECIES: mycofactocin-coupled SDR family oxidoreductase [Pseudonocardia]OSY39668.1 putative short-chain type dehydrogenase/reductase [Pseudonocardia autotrophica]TDN72799.1 (+)-trans-carveol dehydrogenase [Pseudonocardia autotrophica]BBG03514.1 oxidoreductase [Pseudonocardia autotrophica]GEC24934.1 oxidoreductase [Pseudonocardia saturnea]